MIKKEDALKVVARHRGDAVVITTMSTIPAWAQISSSPLDLPLTGAMSQGGPVGLGIALAQPGRKVIVLDGDGSLLMNLGILVTAANVAPANLYHFVFENQMYEVTGGQPTPGAGKFSFTAIGRAAGYPQVYEFSEMDALQRGVPTLLQAEGPVLVDVKVSMAATQPVVVAGRVPISEAARSVRAALTGAG